MHGHKLLFNSLVIGATSGQLVQNVETVIQDLQLE